MGKKSGQNEKYETNIDHDHRQILYRHYYISDKINIQHATDKMTFSLSLHISLYLYRYLFVMERIGKVSNDNNL